MTVAIFDLALIVFVATILGFLVRLLKQPLILAYIFTGVILAVFNLLHLVDLEVFKTFSELGVMFLLFLIGLEINYTSLRLVGRTSIIVGLAQVIFTFGIGLLITLLFGFSYIQSAYISIALTFSSTIIVVKLLSEKKDLNSLYGKISVGLLLVQDFFAILILVLLTGIKSASGLLINGVIISIFKTILLLALMFWLGRKILPTILDKISRSEELLFIGSLAWCLGVATLVMKTGFSIEMGGFLAGLALANSSEHFEISAKIKSLRDFFILLFFVILGSSLTFFKFSTLILPVIVLSLFVIIGNPLIVLIIMSVMGYRKRTSFLCGITVAQVSEFSLILATIGLELGHLNPEIVSLITAVGVITIALSAYLIIYNEEVFEYLSHVLSFFERKLRKEEPMDVSEFQKPIVLVGYHRLGQNIATNLRKEDLLVIDFDPNIVSLLRKQRYTFLFGDIADEEILEKSNLANARLVISTSPDFEDNLRILNKIDSYPTRPKIILRAENEKDTEFFYEKGADYVILPYLTSGQYLGRSIAIDPELKILEQLKNKDLELIKKINKNNKIG